MIRVEYDDRVVLDYLTRLGGKLDDMSPVLSDIGEYLADTTKNRFDTSTAPDGSKWTPNSVVTILNYLGIYSGSYNQKDGKLSANGAGRVMSKKPLIGETRSLMSTIFYRLDGNTAVEIGSPMEYSAMQQFGGTKGQFQNLWGDIPAREFLGVSPADERGILGIITDYFQPI